MPVAKTEKVASTEGSKSIPQKAKTVAKTKKTNLDGKSKVKDNSGIEDAKRRFPAEYETDEVGDYLIRINQVSAAQALSRSEVEFTLESREKQLGKLREFRKSTEANGTKEVDRWLKEKHPKRQSKKSDGLISNGTLVRMTYAEAKALQKEVSDVQIIRNRALTLISPTRISEKTDNLATCNCWHLEAIGLAAAQRDGKHYTGAGIGIALMDTGVDLSHPEINGKIVGKWKIRPNSTDNSFRSLEEDHNHYDTDGHGTHVAGLLVGSTVGVAPDAHLVSITMMPKRIATLFDFIRCLDWATHHPEISLLNFSAGITPFSAEMMPFISDMLSTGALPIMAIGNDGQNNTRSPGNYVDGISVGSVDSPGQAVSSFSGSGKQIWNQVQYEVPDLVAPGRDIWSSSSQGKYISMSGTSMATPIVCGIAACLLEKEKGLLTNLDLVNLLLKSCVALPSEPLVRQGAGLIQAPRKP